MSRHHPSLAKGLLAGLCAGLTATLVMDQFQAALAASKKEIERRRKLADGESPWEIAHEQTADAQKQEASEGSTEVVARKIAEAVGYTIPKEQRKAAGQAVHYTFGTLMGVGYSVASEYVPAVTAGCGSGFGSALFLGADEVVVPALQLTGPPKKMPLSAHAEYWAAHLVYGTALELTRRLVRRLL